MTNLLCGTINRILAEHGTDPITTPRVNGRHASSTQAAFSLLLACTRVRLSSSRRSYIRQLVAAGVDWESFWTLAAYHRVSPLVYASLKEVCPASLPSSVVSAMERSVHRLHSRNRYFLKELHRILKVLGAAGLPALPFKGPLLAELAYGSLKMRASSDLDLLVHPSTAHDVMRCLVSVGYRRKDQYCTRAHRRMKHLLDGQFTAVRGAHVYAIDLHTRVLPPLYAFNPDFDGLWERSRMTAIRGVPVRMLAPEDHLLLLCHHGIKNRWDRLTYVFDVAAFLEAHSPIAWEMLLERARRLQGLRALSLGVCIAQEVLDATVPSAARAVVASTPGLEAVVRRLIDDLPRQRDHDDAALAERCRFHLTTQDTTRARLRYVAMAAVRRFAMALGG